MSEGYAPLRVVLSAAVNADSGRTAETFVWHFGDGTPPSRGAQVIHEFREAGEYVVRACAVWSGEADPSDTCQQTTVRVRPAPNARPVAYDVTADTRPESGTILQLLGSDPEGQPLSFRITAGPAGGTLTPADETGLDSSIWLYIPSSGFVGVDSFSFVCSDGQLDSAPATALIHVGGDSEPPPATEGGRGLVIRASAVAGTAPLRVALTAVLPSGGSAPSGGYVWDFGDGTPPATGKIVAHTFASAGTFTVQVCPAAGSTPTYACGQTQIRVAAGEQGAGSESTTSPSGVQPGIAIRSTAWEGPAPLRVALSAVAPPGGSRLSGIYAWSFDDQTPPQQGSMVVHTFTAPGSRAVTLCVLDRNDGTTVLGCTTAYLTVTAGSGGGPSEPPIAGTQTQTGVVIEASRLTGTAPLRVAFVASAPEGMSRTAGTYVWSFPDDSTEQRGSVVVHTFRTAGTFEVTLCAMGGPDQDQALACDTETITVTAGETGGGGTTERQTGLAIRLSVDRGLPPLRVALSAVAPEGRSRTPGTYVWDFGDGSAQARGAVVAHTFTTPGAIPVTVCAVGGADGQTVLDCASATVYVESLPNTAPVVGDVSVTVFPELTTPINLAATDADGHAVTFRIVTPPGRGRLGSLRVVGLRQCEVDYTPTAGFAGEDSFRYVVNDGIADSNTGTVRILVRSRPAPPNHPSRQPQWPLKTTRTLYTDADIQGLRQRAVGDELGRWLTSAYVRRAQPWLDVPDERLRQMLPDYRVPRDSEVCAAGCPVHGTAVFQHGTFPWLVDPEDPFRVTCPVGGEKYPSNDFRMYYEFGMQEPALLTGSYADDGRGWQGPDGQRYWFVAYANHWNWYKTWLPAVKYLSGAYALTGNPAYARKAIVLLDRIAEIYPGMDYSRQSRMGALTNGTYRGKLFNHIWECWHAASLPWCYDLVFDRLVGPDAVSLPWRSAEQIRANIEANLLEEIIDAVGRRQIFGQYGDHQTALATAVIVRQQGPTQTLLDRIFTLTGAGREDEGLDYALYNLILKDGTTYEVSPPYGATIPANLTQLDRILRRASRSVDETGRLQRMFDAQLDLICTGAFTPALGDSGSITSGWMTSEASAFKAAYRLLGRPAYAWALQQLGGLNEERANDIDELFEQPVLERGRQDAAAYAAQYRPPVSRVLDGGGVAILNNAADTAAVSMFYGPRGAHGHDDGLNIELFAYGRRLSPDLGYPDAMNQFVPGMFSWTTNTVSHNCMVVDDRRMSGRVGATALRFHDAPGLRVFDADYPTAYPVTSVYRRTLVMVDVGRDDAYLVDVFRVRGGSRHVWSMHGPEGTFNWQGDAISAPVTQGSLAGSDVPYGALYDDPILGAAGYNGGYGSYMGSGYSHLFNWQRVAAGGSGVARWQPPGNPPAQLRIHLPSAAGQDIVVADAYVSPMRRVNTVLKYVLLRRDAGNDGNTFVAVWEMAGGTPIIDRVVQHTVSPAASGSEAAVALSVRRGSVTDVIVISPSAGVSRTVTGDVGAGTGLSSDAVVTLVSAENGQWKRAFAAGGSAVTAASPARQVVIPATIRGTIAAVDYTARTIDITATNMPADLNTLVGRKVRIFNSLHSSLYTVAAVAPTTGGFRLTLGGSDVFTGRVRAREVNTSALTLTTDTMMFSIGRYPGMWMVSDDRRHLARIESVSGSTFQLRDETGTRPLLAAATSTTPPRVWIADFGPGDQIEIERFAYVTYP